MDWFFPVSSQHDSPAFGIKKDKHKKCEKKIRYISVSLAGIFGENIKQRKIDLKSVCKVGKCIPSDDKEYLLCGSGKEAAS